MITLTTLLLAAMFQPQLGTQVLTRSYNNARTGANTTETTFTPDLVAKGLVRVKSLVVPDDPRIEAQPLYVPGLKINNEVHNVVFVSSMGNHVFAFDADAPQGKDLLWTSSLSTKPYDPIVRHEASPTQHRETNVDLWGVNILWGVISTPVVDLDANQMYLVSWTEGPDPKKPVMLLHRIRLSDGKEIGTGQLLKGTLLDANGKPVMDARKRVVQINPDQKQRAALLLSPLRGSHKTLFIGVTGGEDPGDPHGWMVAIDVDTFKQTAAIPTTQKGFGGGIWQGSQGPSSDDQGNVYVMTGNGGFNKKINAQDTNPGALGDFNGTTDFAEAFLKFNYQRTGAGKGTLKIADWFIAYRDSERTPPNGQMNYQDQDLGSGGPILPPETNLVLGAGKDGILYVLDRENLGKKVGDLSVLKQNPPIFVTFNGQGLKPFPPNIDFTLGGDPTLGETRKTHHLHGSPVYWNELLFTWGENESLRKWKVDPQSGHVDFMGKSAEIASHSLALDNLTIGGMTGGMVSVSSNGTNNGIVWTLAPVDANANQAVVRGIARAYDAVAFDPNPNADGTAKLKLLWDSSRSGVTFDFSKFCPPMVADGKLYVATYNGRVDVYALSPVGPNQ
jgi:hypothetical protein